MQKELDSYRARMQVRPGKHSFGASFGLWGGPVARHMTGLRSHQTREECDMKWNKCADALGNLVWRMLQAEAMQEDLAKLANAHSTVGKGKRTLQEPHLTWCLHSTYLQGNPRKPKTAALQQASSRPCCGAAHNQI